MRIQILPLPSVVVGDDVEEPFALIVDEWPEGISTKDDETWLRFANSCGARAILATPQTVEVVDRYTESAGIQPATPVRAHELHKLAEQESGKLAWLHNCGELNPGYWQDRATCGGCRFSVERVEDVEEHYRLVPVEVLTGEDGAS